MKLLLDLTRANPQTESRLFSQAFGRYPTLDATDITVFRYPDQYRPPAGHDITVPRGTNHQSIAATVLLTIHNLLERAETEVIEVYTFHTVVFRLSERLTPDAALRVKFLTYKSLFPEPAASSSGFSGAPASAQEDTARIDPPTTSGSKEDESERPLPSSTESAPIATRPMSAKPADSAGWPSLVIPMPEALDALFRALATQGAVSPATAIQKTELRPWLAWADVRLSKSRSNVPGLVTGLLRHAAERGIVALDDSRDVHNPKIWLTDTAANKKRLAVVDGSKRVLQAPSRSQQFIDVLRGAHLGPFSGIRTRLYDALESAVRVGTLTVGEVLKRTIDLAREAETDAGRYPWRAVRAFLITLLSRRPVLLDVNGGVVAPSFGTLDVVVSGMVPTWRLDLDGELLLELASKTGDLQLADSNGIAGALYFDRSDEAELSVSNAMSHLIRTGRLRVSEGYPHRLCAPTDSDM